MSNAITRRSAPNFTGHGLPGLLSTVLRLPVVFLDLMIDWQQRSEERAAMRHLSRHQRRDVGLTTEMLQSMAGKARWIR